MAQARNRRQYYPSELGAATSCPPSSEGAGRKRTPAMEHRAVLRPYLDGLERRLRERFPKTTVKGIAAKVNFVRYADDFLVTGRTKELLEQEVKPRIEEFLRERGLQLSVEKTLVTHIEDGFDFLGQNVRKYQTGKRHKLLITPSKKECESIP